MCIKVSGVSNCLIAQFSAYEDFKSQKNYFFSIVYSLVQTEKNSP